MQQTPRSSRLFLIAAAIVSAIGLISCSDSDSTPPTTPTTPTISITGISLSPASITAGGTVQGTVTISGNAPTGGSVVGLASSATGVATVPASVTVAAGATTATFTVTSVAAGSSTITATLSGSQTATITVTAVVVPPVAAPTLLGVSLSATSVQGGNTLTGAATLTGPAQAGGAVVTLTWADPISAPTPTSVTVAPGQTSATFTVTTRAVGGTIPTTISASFGGVTASAALSVTPIPPAATLASLTVSPGIIGSGGNATGTVTLDMPAPAGGSAVAITSSVPSAASVPVSVTVLAGATSANFNIASAPVGAQTNVVITATLVTSRTATLVLNPSLPIARFTITGPSGSDACKLINGGNSFDCTFDATNSSSLGMIVFYDWTYASAGSKSETVATPVFAPNPTCTLLPSPLPTTLPASFGMVVTLIVRDNLGNQSLPAMNNNVRILPGGVACGF